MPNNKVKPCDSFCKDCGFSSLLCGDMLCCNYYLITENRRPCPAGFGCKVKQKGRIRKTRIRESTATTD